MMNEIPAWTLGWRLQRALAHAGVSVEAIADELGVSRSTISRWLNDRGAPPRPLFVKAWALRTGVSYDWLRDGDPVAGVRIPGSQIPGPAWTVAA